MFYPNYYQPQYGMGVNQLPKAKNTQPLTPEMISKLRASGDNFKIEVSEEDLWRAACTHKENGQPTLVSEGVNPVTGNDILRCTICGETFEMIDAKPEEVQAAVDLISNLLQTSKTMYLDAPANLITQYYQMLPLLKKFPKLYERSQKNFAMYENAMYQQPGTVVSGANGFQMMGAMLSNPYAAYGGYPQAPMAGMPQAPGMMPNAMPQAPMYQQPAPVAAAPGMMPGYPQAPMYQQPMYGNPFMTTGAPVGQAPAPAPMAAPAPGVMPQAPVENAGEVQQQKQFNV